MPARAPIRYTDDVEELQPDEDTIVAETVQTMRHHIPETHAKRHGVVVGTLEVLSGLPIELGQGLFAKPGTYEIVLCYASESGVVEPDAKLRALGLALKVLNAPGEKLREGWTSQDFLFDTWSVGPQGMESRFDRTPSHHPVGNSYYTQGAFRHGDFIAKYAIEPRSDATKATAEQVVGRGVTPGLLRDSVHNFYATNTAMYALRAQLCTDLKQMPVEDASKTWDEKQSPFRTLAILTLPAQESFSPTRRTYSNAVLVWRPGFGLVAHRPLGSINRVWTRICAELGALRHENDAHIEENPATLEEIPA